MLVKKGRFARYDKKCQFEGNNYIGKLGCAKESFFGRFSYIGDYSYANKMHIGRFTSIAPDWILLRGSIRQGILFQLIQLFSNRIFFWENLLYINESVVITNLSSLMGKSIFVPLEMMYGLDQM